MEKMKDTVPGDKRFDLTHFIRSVQRIEGNPDCFGKANGRCDQPDCCWRLYCLNPTEVSTKQITLAWTNKEVHNGKGKGKA